MSPITQDQWKKVFKSLLYAFISGFTGFLTLEAMQVISHTKTAKEAFNFGVALVVAATIAGINAVLVAIKQLFTEPKE